MNLLAKSLSSTARFVSYTLLFFCFLPLLPLAALMWAFAWLSDGDSEDARRESSSDSQSTTGQTLAGDSSIVSVTAS